MSPKEKAKQIYEMSIDIKDLRIGNWVQHEPYPDEKWLIDMRLLESIDLELVEVVGIPLTPEILVDNCGFKYGITEGIASLDEDEKEGDTYYWDINIKGNEHCDSINISLVKWGESDFFTLSLQWLRVRIKYLHEIQNIYYDFSHKELEIKNLNQ